MDENEVQEPQEAEEVTAESSRVIIEDTTKLTNSTDDVKRNFLLWALVDGIRKRDDWWTVTKAVEYYDSGLFGPMDLGVIKKAIVRRNKDKGLSPMDEYTDNQDVTHKLW